MTDAAPQSSIMAEGAATSPASSGRAARDRSTSPTIWSLPIPRWCQDIPELSAAGTSHAPALPQVNIQVPGLVHEHTQDDDREADAADFAQETPLDAELAQAIGRSDAASCARCVAQGANIHLEAAGGKPLLFYAVMRTKSLDIVELLIDRAAAVDHKDDFGNQVLHLWARATRARDELLNLGRCLIRCGAAVDAERQDGMTPLHLLVAGHNSHRGWLDFHKALLLVRHGARIDARAPCGRIPLDMLRQNQRVATGRFFDLLRNPRPCLESLPDCGKEGCAWCDTRQVLCF